MGDMDSEQFFERCKDGATRGDNMKHIKKLAQRMYIDFTRQNLCNSFLFH